MNISITFLTFIILIISLIGMLAKVIHLQRVFENPMSIVHYEDVERLKYEIIEIYDTYSGKTDDKEWIKAIQTHYFYSYAYYQMQYFIRYSLISLINFTVYKIFCALNATNEKMATFNITIQVLLLILFFISTLIKRASLKTNVKLRLGAFLLKKTQLEDSNEKIQKQDFPAKTV